MTTPFNDPVAHPSHYTSGKFEVIDIIGDQLTPEQFKGFLLGNSLKYICRCGKKNPDKAAEDLRKAIWYLEKTAQTIEKEQE